jgi:SAM-dependent methyltransferase
MPSNGLTLNLGSGKDYKTDCVNADIRADVGADWVVDICKLSLGEVIQSPVGLVTIKPFCFDRIIANDVLEHIPDLVTAMTNCRDLLREGGEMHIHVPYDLSHGAWQDPTHVRAFNEKSWVYYCEWAWYLGWKGSRFELTHLQMSLSNYGASLELPQEEILRLPRAVDSMYVILKKVPYEDTRVAA